MRKWNLDSIYNGYDDPSFVSDLNKVDRKIDEFSDFANSLSQSDTSNNLKKGLQITEDLYSLLYKLMGFINLKRSTNTSDSESNNYYVKLQQKFIKTTLPSTLFDKFIYNISNLDEIIEKDEQLNNLKFYLNETKAQGVHLLPENEEMLAAKLNNSGGSLLNRMHGTLTSSLQVEYNGNITNLSAIRNLAYDPDPEVRKSAYYAELKAYKKIDKSIAFCLNGIKNQAVVMNEARGYKSVLDSTIERSRITFDVLESLLKAMREYLPEFRKYLKRKAKILGHNNGLPFYDLFAPMGSSNKQFSIEEAQEFILKNFQTFSSDLHDLAKKAFDNNWIDYTPREGKRGGAFCSSIHSIKESRILTNFSGSISDVTTIAHELGHAYHNYHIFDENFFNSQYPMPIAETASILCETIVKKAAFNEATSNEEKIGMLEQELQDSTQVIVDILSRYIFESNVIDNCQNQFLNENDLYDLMADAQLQTYGDGLNPEILNPGMWINKSHYYSAGLSFYNFPYAFGLLFSKGIYGKYEENGQSFVEEIKKLLKVTGKMNLVDVAKTINIDITDIKFWRQSLEVIKEDINLFLELTKDYTK